MLNYLLLLSYTKKVMKRIGLFHFIQILHTYPIRIIQLCVILGLDLGEKITTLRSRVLDHNREVL